LVANPRNSLNLTMMEPCTFQHLAISEAPLYGGLFLGFDFHFFLAAAKLFWSGQDPYDVCSYTAQLRIMGREMGTGAFSFPFPYPPNFLPFLIFFVPFNFMVACYGWISLLILSVLVIAHKLNEIFIKRDSAIWVLCIIFVLPPTIRTIVYGQLSILLVLLWLFVYEFRKKEKMLSAGVLASIALVKPHFAIVPLLGLSLYDLKRKETLWIQGVLLGSMAQILICYLINSSVFMNFYETLPAIYQSHADLASSLQSYSLLSLLPIPHLDIWFMVFVVLLAIFISLQCQMPEIDRISLLLVLSTVFSQYLWLHDFFLLVPAIFLFLRISACPLPLCLGVLTTLMFASSYYLYPSANEYLGKLVAIVLFAYLLLKNQSVLLRPQKL